MSLKHPGNANIMIGRHTDENYPPVAVDAEGRVLLSGASIEVGEVVVTSLPPEPVPTVAQMTRVAINAAASGDNTLVAGTALQTIRVHKFELVVTADVSLKFKNGAGADFHPAHPFYARGSWDRIFDGEPHYVTSAGNDLILNLSAAVQVSGDLYYTKS